MSEASIHSTSWTQDNPGQEHLRAASGLQGPAPESSRWIGWIIFAAMLLILVGICQLVAGTVALVNDDYFQSTVSTRAFLGVDQQTWGILHIVLGAVAILTAAGLLTGRTVARVVACGVALLGAVISLLGIGAYPLWSIVLVTVNVLVLYAVAVHGGEMKPAP